MAATLTLTPTTPAPGATVAVKGSGFTKNLAYHLTWNHEDHWGTIRASSTGTFTATVTAPQAAGPHTLYANRTDAAAVVTVTAPVVDPPPVTGDYFVSKTGSGTDGRSWATAWNELNQINWALIQPGDTIVLDGGASGMEYRTTLTVAKSGTADKPIIIERATEAGHNGQVVIFGGRGTPLPYCGQTGYAYQASGVRSIGIDLGTSDWIILDGVGWRGIVIHGHNGCGLRLRGGSANCSVSNLEIYDNGTARSSGGAWQSDEPGVRFDGSGHTFSRMLVHDNGQDAFQDNDEGFANLTLRESWLYNERQHPNKPGLGFNYCTHADGIQVWGGGVQSGLLVEDCILGPGLTNALILGDPGEVAYVHDVTVRHTLFINAESNHLLGGDDDWPCKNWTIQNVTSYMTPEAPNGGHCGIELAGSGHTIKDSIFYQGCLYLPGWSGTTSGNCTWKTGDPLPGSPLVADPQFTGPLPTTNTPTFAEQVGADFTLKASSPCLGKGSRIASVQQLLSLT